MLRRRCASAASSRTRRTAPTRPARRSADDPFSLLLPALKLGANDAAVGINPTIGIGNPQRLPLPETDRRSGPGAARPSGHRGTHPGRRRAAAKAFRRSRPVSPSCCLSALTHVQRTNTITTPASSTSISWGRSLAAGRASSGGRRSIPQPIGRYRREGGEYPGLELYLAPATIWPGRAGGARQIVAVPPVLPQGPPQLASAE